MKRYLVDLENVPLKKFISAITTSEKDEVVLFFSQNTACDFKSLYSIKSKIKLVECQVGPKNAMDLQIALYIGQNINRKRGEYIIISNDKGYDCLTKLAFNDVTISRISVDCSVMQPIKVITPTVNSVPVINSAEATISTRQTQKKRRKKKKGVA